MKCLTCKHCSIDFGERGYSDMTPGSPGHWECRKGKWSLGVDDGDGDGGKEAIEEAFAKGETCEQWQDDGRRAYKPSA